MKTKQHLWKGLKGVLGVMALGWAQVASGFTYTDTDLLLVFRKEGFNDLVYNVGTVSNFLNKTSGTQAALSGFDLAVVKANYNNSLAGVKFVLAAVTPVEPVLANRRTWITDVDPGSLPTDLSNSKWSNQRSRINGLGVTTTDYTSSNAVPYYAVSSGHPSSYTQIVTLNTGTDVNKMGGAFDFSVEQEIPGNARFFELKVNNGAAKPAARQVGSFAFTAAGVLTFTAGASAVAAPTIAQAPANVVVRQGGTATFSVSAGGTGPFTYQWSRNSVALTDQTNAVLVLNEVQPSQEGNFSVVVSNAGGSTPSPSASLQVVIPPSLVKSPQPLTVPAGTTVSMSVEAAGTGPLFYQWFYNNNPLAGATTATLTITNVASAHAGHYIVSVSNSVDRVASTPVLLTVEALNVPRPTLAKMTLQNGTFSLQFASTAGARYQVRFSTDLALPLREWTVTSEILQGTGGDISWQAQSPGPGRFYALEIIP